MSRLRSLLSRVHRREGGQSLVFFAAAAAVLFGAVGMAIDVGKVVSTRTDLQKTADAAVFAGAQDLPQSSSAISIAGQYVTKNTSGATAEISITQTTSPSDTITVTVKKRVNYTFMRVLGLSGSNISAKAVARKAFYNGGAGLLPWGFIASPNDNSKLLQNSCYVRNDSESLPVFTSGVRCTVKYGAGTNAGGDFGALTLGQAGAQQYRDNITYGSTDPYKRWDYVDSETGDMAGPTAQGIDARIEEANKNRNCDTRDEVLKNGGYDSNGYLKVTIMPGCESSPLIGVIPVVDKIENPLKSQILGFVTVFIHRTTNKGGKMAVEVEFVEFMTELPNGIYNGSSGAAVAVKLVE